MKYTVTILVNNRHEYKILEGTAYIGFMTMGGSGFRIDKVEKNQVWCEGVGEEFVYIDDSPDKVEKYVDDCYL